MKRLAWALWLLLGAPAAALAAVPEPVRSDPADGSWEQLAPPAWLIWHSSVYDAGHDRLLVFGGMDGSQQHDDLWELPLSGDGGWRKLPTSGTPPPRLRDHGAVYDPVRDRMWVFGGRLIDPSGNLYYSLLWSLDLASDPPEWTEVVAAGVRPAARTARGMVHDSTRDRILVFGGLSPNLYRNDTWSLELGATPTWTQIMPTGTWPVARSNASLVYDPARDRVLLFGGLTSSGVSLGDLWELRLSGTPAWVELDPLGTPPPGRYGHTALYDPVQDRMLVLNGNHTEGSTTIGLRDGWQLALAGDPVWSEFTAPGPQHPGGGGGSVAWDTLRRRALLYGGWTGNTASVHQKVWGLSLDGTVAWSPAWEARAPPATGRMWSTGVLDPTRDRMIVFGGYSAWVGEPAPYLDDVWTLALAPPHAWEPLHPAGAPPPGRYGHSAIYDPGRDRMLVYGGTDGSPLADLWELALSGTPTWRRILLGTAPPGRSHHSAIYDPAGDRMLVFGGRAATELDDLWELPLSGGGTWTQITTAGPGPSRLQSHTAIYDSRRERMVLFGGYSTTRRSDTWALGLGPAAIWEALDPVGAPDPKYGHVAIHDPSRDAMWIYGGLGGPNEVWKFSFTTPTPLLLAAFDLAVAPDGVEIRWRTSEPSRAERFRLTAGRDEATWEVPIEPQSGFEFVALDRSPRLLDDGPTRYMLFHCEADGACTAVAERTVVLDAALRRTRLELPYPNPATRAVVVSFVLSRPQRARLVVTDVAGREVARLLDGVHTAGAGRIVWSGVDRRGRPVAAGVYIVRLAAGDGTWTRKVVVAR